MEINLFIKSFEKIGLQFTLTTFIHRSCNPAARELKSILKVSKKCFLIPFSFYCPLFTLENYGTRLLFHSELRNVLSFTRSKIFKPNFTPRKIRNNFGTFSTHDYSKKGRFCCTNIKKKLYNIGKVFTQNA